MAQYKAYPRNPFERHGIIGGRLPPPIYDDRNYNNDTTIKVDPSFRTLEDRDKTPRHARDGVIPDCAVVATKRIGFGTTQTKVSQPMTLAGSDVLIKNFDNKNHLRYRINVYLRK